MSPVRLPESLKPLKMSRVAILERNRVNNIDRKSWPLCAKTGGYYCRNPHCSACGHRLKAEMVNKEFLNFLKEFSLDKRTAELFKLVILDDFANDSDYNREYKAQLAKQLTESNNKLSRARELLLVGDLDPSDYKNIKLECDENIVRAEAQLQDFSRKKYSKAQLEPILNDVIDTICDLHTIFTKSSIEDQRRLIGSMFKEKFNFENVQHRTAEMTEAFSRIYLIKNKLGGKKKGQKVIKNSLPRHGWKDILMSTEFINDLMRLANMRAKMMELDPQLPATRLAS